MCQMCDEYEAELRRMGLTVEARKVRAERHSEIGSAAESKQERSDTKTKQKTTE